MKSIPAQRDVFVQKNVVGAMDYNPDIRELGVDETAIKKSITNDLADICLCSSRLQNSRDLNYKNHRE